MMDEAGLARAARVWGISASVSGRSPIVGLWRLARAWGAAIAFGCASPWLNLPWSRVPHEHAHAGPIG